MVYNSVSLFAKAYVRLLRWAWARPSIAQRCLFTLLALLSVLLLSTLAAAQVMKLIANDPCVVMREAAQSLAEGNEVAETPLPKIIHQQWKTEQVPGGEFKKWHEEFKRLFPSPEFKHELWTDARMRSFIQSKYPWFLETYDNYPIPVQRADAVRYFILYTFGGLYVDLDYEVCFFFCVLQCII